MAQAGFWTGLVGTVWAALAAVLVLGVFALGGTVHSSFEQHCRIVGQDGTASSG
jgi:hypothetical protein